MGASSHKPSSDNSSHRSSGMSTPGHVEEEVPRRRSESISIPAETFVDSNTADDRDEPRQSVDQAQATEAVTASGQDEEQKANEVKVTTDEDMATAQEDADD
ncbi:unnamed protein product [Peronospora belbahrii]|uniref:Uncharacterized protein n=1 Tax=Peronospora belbahrii TaxID=622444 RepID=A0ABN8DDN2_9STRA|nr:unnamed protein product [Peronospora belbahrii]